MKNVLTIVTAFTFLVVSCTHAQTQNSKTNLSAAEFSAKIKSVPNASVIDVRTPVEFAEGHIKNAKNIDWNGNSFDAQTSKLDKSKPVFVYCLSGGRSAAAAGKLRSDGFKEVYELVGGMKAWRSEKLPESK